MYQPLSIIKGLNTTKVETPHKDVKRNFSNWQGNYHRLKAIVKCLLNQSQEAERRYFGRKNEPREGEAV